MNKKSKINKIEFTDAEQESLNVLRLNKIEIDKVDHSFNESLKKSENTLCESEKLFNKYNIPFESENTPSINKINLRQDLNDEEFNEEKWIKLVNEAHDVIGENASIDDILLPEEIAVAEQQLNLIKGQFNEIHRLDKIDWLISCLTGSLAALIDVFLVQMPKHPGFLGSKSQAGGPLSNLIRDKVQTFFSPNEIKQLENENWVPFDPSTSNGLSTNVPGLGPRSHRFQSLGHDPLLGFLFGVKDILSGSFTAIGSDGNFISQNVDVPPEFKGMGLFAAILKQFGHLKSDVSTPAGLPAPLMPLLQLIKSGSFGKRNYSIGQVTRIMYRQGYDFSHFLSMSIPVMVIEVLVRGGYFIRRITDGYKVSESIPLNVPNGKLKPKLQTMLFTAHTISTSSNIAKTAITQNPLAINYPQWIMFMKALYSQLNWVLNKKPKLFDQHFNEHLFDEWDNINSELILLWEKTFSDS